MTSPKSILGAALVWIVLLCMDTQVEPAFAGEAFCDVYEDAPTCEAFGRGKLICDYFARGSNCEYLAGGPICADPFKVDPAVDAWREFDIGEIERLGCVALAPNVMRLRVVRCEPTVMIPSKWDMFDRSFSYPVRRDASLPRSVCEIEGLSIEGHSFNFFINYFSIIPTE